MYRFIPKNLYTELRLQAITSTFHKFQKILFSALVNQQSDFTTKHVHFVVNFIFMLNTRPNYGKAHSSLVKSIFYCK